MNHRRRSWLHYHGLSIVVGAVLLLWTVLYLNSDPQTHLGAFYGNAIADWTGSFVTIVATKFWYERGSAESRRLPKEIVPGGRFIHDHSLTIVLLVTWVGWIWWYRDIDPNGKTGQVIGNIVSEWTQIISLVWFTKYLTEKGSKESHS